MANKRFLWECAALAVLVPVGPAAGFGPAGHLIAGSLAEPRLCTAARAEVDRLGAGASLGELGLWADTIRGEPRWQHSAPWHYVNIDDPPPGTDPAAAIRAFRHPPEGDVLAAIERFRGQVADRARPAAARAEALKFLVHFVVDVHQPLHVGRAADRGGNTVDVRYGTAVVNLHRFWDTDVLELRRLGVERYVRLLTSGLDAAAPGDPGDFRSWAAESLALRGMVYSVGTAAGGTAPIVLGDDYLTRAQRVSEERLVLAAVRLAATLNQAFCPPSSAGP